MPSHRKRLDDAKRGGLAELTNLGVELRAAREQAGLSQVAVAARLGWPREKVGRIENARLRTASLLDLASHSGVLGLTMRARVYPDAPPLRDVAQLSVTRRFLARISPAWRVRMEVPLGLAAGDRRAFDLSLSINDTTIAVEVFSRLRDVQAQFRSVQLKWRDSEANRLLVVLAQSHANRAGLGSVRHLLASDFPVGARAALLALGKGLDPGGNAILMV